jgi:hypothetical protein
MKRFLLIIFGVTALAAPVPKLEPRVHFIHEWEGGDAFQLYYEIPQPLVPNDPFGGKPGSSTNNDIKTVAITGLPLKNWRIVDAFGKRNIELNVNPKVGLDVTFNSLKINGVNVNVAPSRVMYLKPLLKYPLSYERLQQQPNDKLFLAMRIFNDSPDTITIEKILYAPKGVSSDQILVSPRYDSEFFSKLERWVAGDTSTIPSGSSTVKSTALNLKILPSRGFGAAILGSSLEKKFSCQTNKPTRDPSKRYDTFISQPIIQYKVGSGKSVFYPIPDQIIADICP